MGFLVPWALMLTRLLVSFIVVSKGLRSPFGWLETVTYSVLVSAYVGYVLIRHLCGVPADGQMLNDPYFWPLTLSIFVANLISFFLSRQALNLQLVSIGWQLLLIAALAIMFDLSSTP